MALALEGTPVHANSSGTSINIGPFTTSLPALIVIVNTVNSTTISSITGGGLTWTKRTAGGASDPVEEWTALAASALSAVTFTINYVGTASFSTADLFAVSGHDASTTFDANASIPANGNADPITVSTNNADDFILGGFRFTSTANPTEGTGWTKISGADFQLTEYKIVSTTQTNLSVSIGTGVGNANGGVADAVRMASAGGGAAQGIMFKPHLDGVGSGGVFRGNSPS
jgi:hypothetical protein